ncbi:MAG: response regulator [Acidobacteria bacterium]|nr:response regulator [Acidobacteriota bacterium]
MRRRSYLTTFEVSRICEVNPTTVQNWIKEKKLQAHVTPGGHRRVRRSDLAAFMQRFGMPLPPGLTRSRPLVLIADDDADTLGFLSEVMMSGKEEVEVITARDGVEALLLIGDRKPDLLILDIRMPNMNGWEVCRRLRLTPASRGLKIAVVTGDHSQRDYAGTPGSGADLFFTKPLDVVEFRTACMKLLGS